MVVTGPQAKHALDEHTLAKWDMRHAAEQCIEELEKPDTEAHRIVATDGNRQLWCVIIVRGDSTHELVEAIDKLMDKWEKKRAA